MNTKVLFKISYGLYLVCSRKGERLNGQVANTVFQIASEPPSVAICINKTNLTHEFIEDSKVFTISILSRDTPLSLIGQFGFKTGRDIDKLGGVHYKLGENKCPIITDHTLGYIEVKIVNHIDAGTHTVFLGLITDADILAEGEPMTYAYYHDIKRGTTPKTAPSYVEEKKTVVAAEEKKEGAPKMAKYVCQVCGYVYDPAQGDPDNGIKPGTPFEAIPDSWTCPVCGASKDQFNKE